jgi:inosine-uridine nucleoside N-ribohydrolase
MSQSAKAPARTPVILDTDIGDDIDDTWALGLLLKCPELDVKLVVGDYGRPQYRARLAAKFLQSVGRSDIPVGVGIEVKGVGGKESQAAWVGNYDLKSYPGKVYEDGVQAIIDTVMKSKEPVTLICIGPVPNIAAALEREPRIARKARFVGMHGSIYKGYGGSKDIHAEWNVKAAPAALQKSFAAPWNITITPLDTCGLVVLSGDRYAQIRQNEAAVPRSIIENYRAWAVGRDGVNPDRASSTLFDCVAIYLAVTEQLCEMEKVRIRVTDDGFTRLDATAPQVNAAVRWQDLDGFYAWMTGRLLAN